LMRCSASLMLAINDEGRLRHPRLGSVSAEDFLYLGEVLNSVWPAEMGLTETAWRHFAVITKESVVEILADSDPELLRIQMPLGNAALRACVEHEDSK
jgi:hypothetical protein